MLTLGDITSEVNKIAVKSGLSSRIPLWAHFVELDVCSRYPFWWRVKNTTLTTVADLAEYSLTPRVDGRRVGKFSNETQDTHISPMDLASQLWSDPTPTETGTPYGFSFSGLSKVQRQPTSASVLACVSSDASDTTQKLLIRGVAGGVDVYEEVTLTGTTPVDSANTYSEIESIAKSTTTTGTVTVTSNTAAVTNISLAPQDIAIECPKIRFQLVPSAAETLRYWFFEKPRRMVSNYDIPLVPEDFQWKTIMYGVLEIAHLNNQDYEQANLYHQRMEAGIQELIEWSRPHGAEAVKYKCKPSRASFKSLRVDYDSLSSYDPSA